MRACVRAWCVCECVRVCAFARACVRVYVCVCVCVSTMLVVGNWEREYDIGVVVDT